MNLLITAGNTQAPIDKVRCLTNIFTGRTGAAIAVEALRRRHQVTLLTSHPDAFHDLTRGFELGQCRVTPFRTFEDLQQAMERMIANSNLDAVIHCAAVSDYLLAGVYAADLGTKFDEARMTWHSHSDGPPTLADRQAGKIKSDEAELWLRLVRAPKIVDKVRRDWAFKGILVKFKLEVGISDANLEVIAEKSRQQSQADLMVANTLEGAKDWALVGGGPQRYIHVSRAELSSVLISAIERRYAEKSHG